MVCLATCKFKVANSQTRNSSITRAVENLKEYFIIFLPQQKNFKREIESTIRYKRIAENLKSTLTLAYLAFAAFVAQDLESSLLSFQRKEPMIHIFYNALGSFPSRMLTKFVPAGIFMDEAGTPEQRMKSIEYLNGQYWCFQREKISNRWNWLTLVPKQNHFFFEMMFQKRQK